MTFADLSVEVASLRRQTLVFVAAVRDLERRVNSSVLFDAPWHRPRPRRVVLAGRVHRNGRVRGSAHHAE